MTARRQAAILFLILLGGLGIADSATAQDSPREVRAEAINALAKGDYENALPLLQQLVQWFSESKDEKMAVQMEPIFFSLGLSYYLTGQFGGAETAFQEYIKRYPANPRAAEAAVYIGDGHRYSQGLDKALKQYGAVLDKYRLNADWKTDVLSSMARCHLAQDDWKSAIPVLEQVRVTSPDYTRRNWAATLLVTAYLKEFELDKVFDLVPILLQGNSFASRSVAYNLAALETADELFADERYRDSLWVYRLVYPHATIKEKSQYYLEDLQRDAERLRESQGRYRELLRVQEAIAEVESEIEAINGVEQYDTELYFRMARAYLETRRFREARVLFLYLHQTAQGEAAEEALYLAFHCSTQIKPWDRAFALGRQYMDTYPGGSYYDTLTLAMGQMHAMLKDWPAVIAVLTEALEKSPKHQSGAECMFLIGYAHFMEEKFADALTWLRRMNATYPGHERQEEVDYWIAMSLLFDKKYEESLGAFSQFLSAYPESAYREDATYRRAVSAYGLSRYRESERLLVAFNNAFPESKLRGEALMMLADISGFFGESPEAVARFKDALNYDLNIELYNYCAFRAGEIMNDLGDWPGIIAHFMAYIERNREESNLPLAVYWIVKAKWQQGERQGALDFFQESVAKYGAERTALGIDVLLEEWVALSRQLSEDESRKAWGRLRELMTAAGVEGKAALALRLQRLRLYQPGLEAGDKALILNDILREDNLAAAPPGVLELMMDEGAKAGKPELAVKAAELLVKDFPETDYALSARMVLARLAGEAGDYDAAIRHLSVVREVFATSSEAAEALYTLGNIHLTRRQFDEADRCFSELLGVKEWRGPLWPAALYGRGEAARLRGKPAEASAYYERIYVMYGNYTEWVAKAYLQRAACLIRLHEPGKAEETLAEMLANPSLGDAPEAAQAREMLGKLKGESL